MTPMQRSVLTAIETLTYDGVGPTMEDIREHCGLTSKAHVHRCVTALERLGYLRRPSAGRKRMARCYEVVQQRSDPSDIVLDAIPRADLWRLYARLAQELGLAQ